MWRINRAPRREVYGRWKGTRQVSAPPTYSSPTSSVLHCHDIKSMSWPLEDGDDLDRHGGERMALQVRNRI